MVKANPNFKLLKPSYLFAELARRKKDYMDSHPDITVIDLGIGDTKQPLPQSLLNGLSEGVLKLGSRETYTGYGPEQGDPRLRKAIAGVKYNGLGIEPSEVFVNDGAKPTTSHIHELFSSDAIVAVQDPAYPVYLNANVFAGKSKGFDEETGMYEGIVYMPCIEDNGFFPEMPLISDNVGIIYVCSPNNPTGATATKEQLKSVVDYALENKAVIIFDSAYERFIQDRDLPHSIYEIKGADRCAIEVGSFSKEAGFTGTRLGWVVVPRTLEVVEGLNPGKTSNDEWGQLVTNFTNGASNIVQEGGIAALSKEGQRETQKAIDIYMKNAHTLRQGLESIGLTCFGGDNAPYIFFRVPGITRQGSSLDFSVKKLLREANVIGTPGSGFGPHGEGYVRLSAFGYPEDVREGMENIKNLRLDDLV